MMKVRSRGIVIDRPEGSFSNNTPRGYDGASTRIICPIRIGGFKSSAWVKHSMPWRWVMICIIIMSTRIDHRAIQAFGIVYILDVRIYCFGCKQTGNILLWKTSLSVFKVGNSVVFDCTLTHSTEIFGNEQKQIYTKRLNCSPSGC